MSNINGFKLTGDTLAEHISFVINSHDKKARKESKRFRKWDGETPYAIHPIWCAMMLLSETRLPADLRDRGAKVLLLHDAPEDTAADLSSFDWQTRQRVEAMTFESFDEEMNHLPNCEPETKLLKLYDKVHNLMDGTWMPPAKRAIYTTFTMYLCEEVEREYGSLNITKLARAITGVDKPIAQIEREHEEHGNRKRRDYVRQLDFQRRED